MTLIVSVREASGVEDGDNSFSVEYLVAASLASSLQVQTELFFATFIQQGCTSTGRLGACLQYVE